MSWKCDTTMQVDEIGPTAFKVWPMFPGDWRRGSIFQMTTHSDLLSFRAEILKSKKMTFVMIDDFLDTSVTYFASRHADGLTSKHAVFGFEEYDGSYIGKLKLFLAHFRVFRFNRDASLPIRQAGVAANGFPLIVTVSTSIAVTHSYN